jgi:co-chaperonin GroES (HSP10)
MLNGWVLVEEEPDLAHSLEAGDAPGLIVMPEAHRRASRRGKVLGTGPGRTTRKGYRVEPLVKKGDRVAFPATVGQLLRIGGRECRILPEVEIDLVL